MELDNYSNFEITVGTKAFAESEELFESTSQMLEAKVQALLGKDEMLWISNAEPDHCHWAEYSISCNKSGNVECRIVLHIYCYMSQKKPEVSKPKLKKCVAALMEAEFPSFTVSKKAV